MVLTRIALVALLAVGLVVVPLPGAHAALPPGGTFIDDDGNVHEGFIEAIAPEGVTRGCDDEGILYCPDASVRRDQVASLLARALGTPETTTDAFDDDDGSIHEDAINRLAASGVVEGCDGERRRYCPADPVRRDQLASLLARGFGLPATTTDAFDDDDGSVHEDAINRAAAAGVVAGCDAAARRFCPAGAARRDQLASLLGRALGLEPTPPPPPPGLGLQEVATGLDAPLGLEAPAGDDRLFVVEQPGTIRVIDGGGVRDTPFLDVSGDVLFGGERGLLGLAFHPDYATNGRFFVNYTSVPEGDTKIVEYRASADPNVADPASAKLLMLVDQPYSNHNGGQLAFGPDRRLYIGLGDGGSAGDPHGHGQDPTTVLGTILRVDVDAGDPYAIPPDNPFDGRTGAREVWAWGLRNPWRFSFDPPSGTVLIADVGQGAWEEVDAAPATAGGLNYGWNRLEGTHCFPSGSACSADGTVLPVVEYSHDDGRSVTGGFVYRGDAMPRLRGTYFYGDYISGFVRSFRLVDGAATDQRDWSGEIGTVDGLASFGVDGHGELYAVSLGGTVSRFVPVAG